ncbi:MAG: VOC family protein [Bacteroidales bacterium]|jgi:lactoylglutathione lyase|nr:VOC family protein [Bacteroidales bacterium]
MKFCWSTLYVKDMEESLNFYEKIIGLALNAKFKAGADVEIAFLGDGETKVELIFDKNKTSINPGTDISWGFEVDSLDDMLQLMKSKGIKIESGPFQPNPKMKFFFIKDPNGMKIQFVENGL